MDNQLGSLTTSFLTPRMAFCTPRHGPKHASLLLSTWRYLGKGQERPHTLNRRSYPTSARHFLTARLWYCFPRRQSSGVRSKTAFPPINVQINLLVQVPLWQTVCGKNHPAARNPDWTTYPCLPDKAENVPQWQPRTAQSDIYHRWALTKQHQVSGQVWPVDVQHCLKSTNKLYSSRSWTSFYQEAQTGTVLADGVCQVSWLVSNLMSCETHPCTFTHHYNHFTHFTLTFTGILVVQSHLWAPAV